MYKNIKKLNWSFSELYYYFSFPDPKSEKKFRKSTNKEILALPGHASFHYQ